MAVLSKVLLSGSTTGLGIKLTDTSTSGNTDAGYLVHTAVSGTTDIDEIWLYAHNSDTSPRKLTVEFGGVTSPDNTIEVTLAAEDGLVLVVPGLPLQNGLLVKAFAGAANVVTVYGYVNRMDI